MMHLRRPYILGYVIYSWIIQTIRWQSEHFVTVCMVAVTYE